MKPARSKKTDAIAVLLKSSFSGRRRSPWRLVVLLVLFVAVVGLLALYFWPTALPSLLIMAVTDAVSTDEEPVKICARLEAARPEQRDLPLAGCELYFQAANSPDLLGKTLTDRNGAASLQARFPESAAAISVSVRYAGIKDRQRGANADGRIFVWPADSSLMVVDADHVLSTEVGDYLWETNNLDVRSQDGAATSLRNASTDRKIIYLSPGSGTPSRYNKLRNWLIQTGRSPTEHFPTGPLLAPICGEGEGWFEGILRSLGQRFHGKYIAIAGREEEAGVFAAAGYETYLIGPAQEPPEGIRVVNSWKELALK